MQSIVFNFSHSCLHQKVEAVTLKIGYLLSSEVCTAGTTCDDMYANENFSGRSLFEKLDFLERMSRGQAKFSKEVKGMRTIMNKMHGTGSRTPKQLAFRKEGEQVINMTYQSYVQVYEDTVNSYGLGEVKKLSKDDNFLFYAMNNNPEDPSGNRITASHLLQRLLFTVHEDKPDEEEPVTEPEIFLFGTEFLRDDYSKPKIYGSTETEAGDTDTIYLHHAFTLTGIEQFTADEIRTVRNNISEAAAGFNQNMNEWMDMCYFNDSPSERLSFFNTQIVPAAAELQQNMESDYTLNNPGCLREDALQTEVWLGEMPVSQLWKYYRDHNAIKDITWRKLQEEKALQNERWPVMMLHIPDDPLQRFLKNEDDEENNEPIEEPEAAFAEEINAEPAEEIKATRKYISID